MQQHYKTYAKHLGLFILTFISVTYAGSELQNTRLSGWEYFSQGLAFSIPFMLFLTCHEFGHYFLAKKYKVEASLPYFIPLPFLGMVGTLGAIIAMKSRAATKRGIFDIGIAGPLAGFVVAFACLVIGFLTLPPREHIYEIHPDYKRLDSLYGNYEKKAVDYQYLSIEDSIHHEQYLKYDSIYRSTKKETSWLDQWFEPENPKPFEKKESYTVMSVGNNLLFNLMGKLLADPDRMPPSYELMHNPLLMAAFWALFFTALNMFPIGQLDGGHVIYGLLGYKKHFAISRTIFLAFVFVAGIGIFKSNIFNINVFAADVWDVFLFAGGYLFLLTQIFKKAFKIQKNVIMVSVIVMAGQFAIEYLFPTWPGFPGWMLFAFLLGRFVGLDHPPALIEEPLDLKQKILGWTSILILILCFTPEPVVFMEILP